MIILEYADPCKERKGNVMFGFEDILNRRAPDFEQFLAVLRRGKPRRPVFYEIFLERHLVEKIGAGTVFDGSIEQFKGFLRASQMLGYDYMSIHASSYGFPTQRDQRRQKSLSLNDGAVIGDWESFEKYPWQDPVATYRGRLEALEPLLPEGMKFVVMCPGGVLENAIRLVGFDQLCYMLADDPDLAAAIFDRIGTGLIRYLETIAQYDCVGALLSNDDWGFKTQTMLSHKDMRRYVFPYHKRIVETAHKAGKPALLHSCGCLVPVMDDVIDDIGFDAKHSFEDTIQPIEEAYETYHNRIALLGGVDMDFLCRSTPEAVYRRSCALLERTGSQGYALGSGNSLPSYVPYENYCAMMAAGLGL